MKFQFDWRIRGRWQKNAVLLHHIMFQQLQKGPKGLEKNQFVLERENDVEITINSKGLKKQYTKREKDPSTNS